MPVMSRVHIGALQAAVIIVYIISVIVCSLMHTLVPVSDTWRHRVGLERRPCDGQPAVRVPDEALSPRRPPGTEEQPGSTEDTRRSLEEPH